MRAFTTISAENQVNIPNNSLPCMLTQINHIIWRFQPPTWLHKCGISNKYLDLSKTTDEEGHLQQLHASSFGKGVHE